MLHPGAVPVPSDLRSFENLKHSLEKADYHVLDTEKGDAVAAANLLKSWLRSLEEPLIPSEFYPRIVDARTLLTLEHPPGAPPTKQKRPEVRPDTPPNRLHSHKPGRHAHVRRCPCHRLCSQPDSRGRSGGRGWEGIRVDKEGVRGTPKWDRTLFRN